MTIRPLAAAALCLAALTACSTTDPDAGSGDGDGSGVRTGNGVTGSEIRIGVLTDLSGPFKAGAAVQVQEKKAYWAARSAQGGICGRKITMDVRDHGYNPQRAVSLYRSMSPDVVALQQVLGSPAVAAVLPLAEKDDLYVGGMGWASVALEYKVAQLPGTTYSIEAANAVDYLVDTLKVPAGSTIGHVYFEGDFGGDSLAGAEHAAAARGLKVHPIKITPQESDMSAQAAALKRADVKGVILGAAPSQLSSLASVLASNGVNVPLIGNTPTFSPALLNTPAREGLLKNFYTVTSVAPYNGEGAGVKTAAEMFEKNAPDGTKGWEVPLAYGQSELLATALEKACENGDLTPKGVVAAMHETSGLDTRGLFSGALDYTRPGEPPTRKVFVSRADAEAPGGLKVLDTIEGPSARSYKFD
ncbi:ABC transporter substrate-binding protein [Actinomadura sp. 6K520]|jgi:ABC-type branched-subunit amino acid transport system substrate-binding protein|uniref:ABC transporter substrate-binding protein n=1 Tax=Actinomadura sp. 6K520 TaxID=2530364 RepID=UPI0010524896|nr:ABC transporter substrate-binding protein [Actinomadura sp. 6K520]TDE19863.1 ABC transporter substrate-binding protein [Actinomadura sp. 6K520]